MKQLIIALGFLTIVNASYGQVEKGTYLIGSEVTSLRIQLTENGTKVLSMRPKVGKFLFKNFAVGVSVPLRFQSYGGSTFTQKDFNIELAAFARHYFWNWSKSSLFSTVNTGFGRSSTVAITNFFGNQIETREGFSYSVLGAGVGYVYFLNEKVGLEGIVGLKDIANSAPMNLTFGVGIQAYL